MGAPVWSKAEDTAEKASRSREGPDEKAVCPLWSPHDIRGERNKEMHCSPQESRGERSTPTHSQISLLPTHSWPEPGHSLPKLLTAQTSSSHSTAQEPSRAPHDSSLLPTADCTPLPYPGLSLPFCPHLLYPLRAKIIQWLFGKWSTLPVFVQSVPFL